MKNGIRMYHTLFSRKYWIVSVYLLFPVMIGLLGLWWWFPLGPLTGTRISLMLATTLMIIAEYLLDFFLLFGFAAKPNGCLEYIKTSSKGVDLLKAMLYVDGVRRIVTTLVSFAVLYAVKRESIIVFVECTLISLLCIEGGFLFTRRIKNVLLYILIGYVISGVGGMLAMFVAEYANGIWVGITACVLVATWIGGRQYLIRKVRESFYDE